jgi:hypothetical protein
MPGEFRPELRLIGESRSPLLVIDNFSGVVDQVAAMADALAPFPPVAGNYYPGVRRVIEKSDALAYAYVMEACRRAAPFLASAFDAPRFDLEEASFSIVTVEPGKLQPLQKAPHFDGPEQNLVALLHYLRVPGKSGTAFYRHRSTGIERVNATNAGTLNAALASELGQIAEAPGYMQGSNDLYEQIGMVEAAPDRVAIYHGSLLHSGLIPSGMTFDSDPSAGRLTANFFLLGR